MYGEDNKIIILTVRATLFTHFEPKLCVFRWPSENFVDCPTFKRMELDFAGETFNEAMPDSRLQKLLAP